MTSLLRVCFLTCCCLALAVDGTPLITMDIAEEGSMRRFVRHDSNGTSARISDPLQRLNHYRDWKKQEAPKRKARMKEDRKRAKEFLQQLPPPNPASLERASPEMITRFQQDQTKRGLSWFASSSESAETTSAGVLADSSQSYDKWAQAYRMLGGFIDCDHPKQSNNHKSGDKNKNNGGDSSSSACSRWMMWAAYVNPNYQGNGYDEYYGDNPTGVLDCHSPETEWELLGVYRQEFYQFIEQISKHLWAIDDYEYIVALAGLSYMTSYECFQVGKDSSGNAIYASVAPQPYGRFEMGLYTDAYCLVQNYDLGKTYDDYGMQSDINLGSKDQTNDDKYDWAYDDWYNSQEYTLTNLNSVYDDFKYCTSCVDYPTYQDGYFIGDDGTDDDNLINQCWKFYSHNSYTCEAECIAMAHAQGTILSVKYGEATFGKTSSSFYASTAEQQVEPLKESPMTRLLANAFLTLSFLLFIATFLAFAVARRSRYRESRSTRSRRLLDVPEDSSSSRRLRRSLSKGPPVVAVEGDGIFRTTRSKSGSRRTRKSRTPTSADRKKRRPKSYEPPQQQQSNDDYF